MYQNIPYFGEDFDMLEHDFNFKLEIAGEG